MANFAGMSFEAITFAISDYGREVLSTRDKGQVVLNGVMQWTLANCDKESGLNDLRPLNQFLKEMYLAGHQNVEGLCKWVLYASGGKWTPPTEDNKAGVIDEKKARLRVVQKPNQVPSFRFRRIDGKKAPLQATRIKTASILKWWEFNPAKPTVTKFGDNNLKSVLKAFLKNDGGKMTPAYRKAAQAAIDTLLENGEENDLD